MSERRRPEHYGTDRRMPRSYGDVNKCPPGEHWVMGHYARNKFGYGTHWVQGHCAKNSEQPEMRVTRQITRTEGGIPHLFRREREIVEEPIDERKETNDVEKDNSHR